jgi:hypothetical protein
MLSLSGVLHSAIKPDTTHDHNHARNALKAGMINSGVLLSAALHFLWRAAK